MRALVTPVILALGVLVACTASDTPATPSDTATPTATAAVPDPDAELERIMELRFGWGLQADEAWVRQVNADPAAVDSPLGIPVTPAEAQEIRRSINEEPRTALIMYGAREHVQFGGLWVNEPGVGMVLLFTGDLERHRQALIALNTGVPFQVRPCRFSEAELRTLQRQLVDDVRRGMAGAQLLSVSFDVKRNVVVFEAKSNDPGLEGRLEAEHQGKLDAQIHPLPGAWQNVPGGPGWRLLFAGATRHGGIEPYSVSHAADMDSWAELWTAVAPGAAPPSVDFDTEIVALFAEGIGSSCPEVRIDGVVIDAAAALVHGAFSDPLSPRSCTADLAGSAVFAVALSRQALPAGPFTLRLHPQPMGCADCPDEVTVDLTAP